MSIYIYIRGMFSQLKVAITGYHMPLEPSTSPGAPTRGAVVGFVVPFSCCSACDVGWRFPMKGSYRVYMDNMDLYRDNHMDIYIYVDISKYIYIWIYMDIDIYIYGQYMKGQSGSIWENTIWDHGIFCPSHPLWGEEIPYGSSRTFLGTGTGVWWLGG